MAKFIFVTGGVVSGLGKGITAASLGRLLKCRGLKVASQKLDPYVNVDPGTMSPLQHGEVFVTDDGTETDLDLGHYERFIDENLNKYSNLTTGKVYWNVLNKERQGAYLGQTVQIIPHITNEIKSYIYNLASSTEADVVITEIGGTTGDIESQPFLEAIRQVGLEQGRDNCCYIHVVLVPYISGSDEYKSKPAQHSVKELQSLGIQPDFLVLRSDHEISAKLREMGVTVIAGEDCVTVKSSGRLRRVNIKTMPYPGFPTDMQPQFAAALCLANGASVITEGIYDNRFKYLTELRKMGAQVQVDGRVALIEGVDKLCGAPVAACDLRAGAAMVIAGLCAEGTTEVEDVHYIERGYENFVGKLRGIGADIALVSDPDEPERIKTANAG